MRHSRPDIYFWIYTNGILADEARLEKLAELGISEIRFNLAATDYSSQVLKNVERARGGFEYVVVEVPSYPPHKQKLLACLEELEPFVCPDVQGRRVAARSETEGYLELKYRILSGKISAAHSAEVIDAIARLMLGSMEWYRSFWADLSRIKGNAGAVGGSGMTTSSDSANFIDMSS